MLGLTVSNFFPVAGNPSESPVCVRGVHEPSDAVAVGEDVLHTWITEYVVHRRLVPEDEIPRSARCRTWSSPRMSCDFGLFLSSWTAGRD